MGEYQHKPTYFRATTGPQSNQNAWNAVSDLNKIPSTAPDSC